MLSHLKIYKCKFPTVEHKTDTASVQELHTTIRAVSTELGDKVAEIQKQDRLVRDLQIQQAILDVALLPLQAICDAYF